MTVPFCGVGFIGTAVLGGSMTTVPFSGPAAPAADIDSGISVQKVIMARISIMKHVHYISTNVQCGQ